jgi:hypothetical protein
MLDGRNDGAQGNNFMSEQNSSQDGGYMQDQAGGSQQLSGSSAATPSSDLDDEIPF